MKKILLCCAAGMSTSMLVKKMQQAADEQALETMINAISISDIEEYLPEYDVVLLGPQVKYELARITELAAPLNKPVAVINMMDYGTMRGDKVLETALTLIG
ncbi:PTS sugar transporter subunit IIB [Photobacterium carnosum]|jgi:PTS system cellobiose-specific IIB component|uniref:PTS sugar transporter subunit IIB n=1 Tax=Photobacterium carnosum TaxID=2023717 RepID=UPI001E30A0E6|nr:PTS sugar transporter subunit IIB [Photobacterium carnosum]MCD9494360.1 PTS sugar transporter subunit IIB [Photobacterium carnosum]MCD9521708.1 PTS sugar transporter subunit IIB [Photobacterium carnosum]MCD9539703.1 PTS sugar transporter subunit IIB [Photobacterium carnosum]MCD9554537.1 PTS sugar transporter subunit IIB [Photobacterium carnosum]MCD9555068.1 PTS sugar transporter subunit IIB [Photobacterium carnosum]